jgi:acetyl esterase/lipase
MSRSPNPEPDAEFNRRLDPEFVPIVANMPVRDYRDIPAARRVVTELLATSMRDVAIPGGVEVTDVRVSRDVGPDVPVRLYRPGDVAGAAALPCLLWIHGGGHVLGGIAQDDQTLFHIVREVGCVAASVEWRQAPEHPYPAELEDCFAGLRWLAERAGQLGIDPGRVAVGGASSGAGTAAGLALMARDRGGPSLIFQLLAYPMLDDRTSLPVGDTTVPESSRMWNHTSNRIAWSAYLGASAGTSAPVYAAPGRAGDLAGLPAAFIAVGELDLFLREDITYAERLLRAGVPTELHVYPGTVHGFDSFGPNTEVSRRFRRDRDDALRRAFAR